MAKTVIVTGGCGYIGSHIARAFKQQNPNNRVHIVDNVYREHTVKGIDGFLIDDYASKSALSLIAMVEPDVIVHCAGTSLVGPSVMDPAIYYDNNVSKTITMLNAIKDLRKKPLILFSSSASVYGAQAKPQPLTEHDAVSPISPYGSTKAIIEMLLKDYQKAYGIDSISFRYFNAAGADSVDHDLGQEPGATHIIARVLEASINKQSFTINGGDYDTLDGTCVRDYVHVQDIADAHLRGVAFVNTLGGMGLKGAQVFNLGSGTGVSNREIVEYVKDKYTLSKVEVGPNRAGDPALLVANADRADMLLGWKPKFTITDMINDAYQWYTRQ